MYTFSSLDSLPLPTLNSIGSIYSLPSISLFSLPQHISHIAPNICHLNFFHIKTFLFVSFSVIVFIGGVIFLGMWIIESIRPKFSSIELKKLKNIEFSNEYIRNMSNLQVYMADNGQSSSSKVEEFSSEFTNDDFDISSLDIEELQKAILDIQYAREFVWEEHSDLYYNSFELEARYEEEIQRQKEKKFGTFEPLSEQESVEDYAQGYSVSFLQNFKTKPREVIKKALDDLNNEFENSNDPVEKEDILENIVIMTKLLDDKDNEDYSGNQGGSSEGPEGSSAGESSENKDKGKGRA